MKYHVKITTQAKEQLREIRDYIAHELLAPEAAQNMLMLLGAEMASLANMPKRVKLVDEEPWRSEGVRVKAVKNYLVYFWINEPEMIVQVFAVIYAKRDQIKILSQLDM